MAVNTTARTPNYQGTSEGGWERPTFAKCMEAYYTHTGDTKPDSVPSDVSDAPQSAKNFISSLSLLGNADADSFRELLFGPCVEPESLALNRDALLSIVQLMPRADIPDSAKNSAIKKAYSLLQEEFDYTDDDVPGEYKSVHFGEQFAEKLIEFSDHIKTE